MHNSDDSNDQANNETGIQIVDFTAESEETICYETELPTQISATEARSVEKPSVTQIIKNWALNEINVPKASISRLLAHLHPIHNEPPKSFKTLLPNPRLSFQPMQEGQYVHFFNWSLCLKKLILHIHGSSDSYGTGIKKYYLVVNVDGLPLFQHSPDFKLYPILITIYGCKMRPLCAGIYCSQQSKNRDMPPPELLLKQFLDDINHLQSSFIAWNGIKYILAKDGLIFCCDAPARSSLKKIVSHCGYKSCERCTVTGVYDAGSRHICLLETNCPLRSDLDFRLQKDARHHIGTSFLTNFGVSMVTRFTLDYMHLGCLGAMKRLLSWWKGVKR